MSEQGKKIEVSLLAGKKEKNRRPTSKWPFGGEVTWGKYPSSPRATSTQKAAIGAGDSALLLH